jgi:NAD(P) transhydrogenase
MVIEAAWGSIQRNLERFNIRVALGTASFADSHTVIVRRDGEAGPAEAALHGAVILLATGAVARRPARFPFDHPRVHDPDTILRLDYLPASLAVVGGGVIGAEYASVFNALGVGVTLIEARPRLLGFLDGEIVGHWQRLQAQRGVRFALEADVARVAAEDDAVRLDLTTGETVTADAVLAAVGRQGNTAGLNLAAAGLTAGTDGMIAVNAQYQTNVPHIYAAGDVVGFPALASTAMEQARVAMTHAFGPGAEPLATVYPLAVYTLPELAMAGLTEEACQQQNVPYRIGRAELAHNARAQITGDTAGHVKLIFAPEDRRLLGVHAMCESASELVHLGAFVLAENGPIDRFLGAVYNYPTLAEAYRVAALDGLQRA